MDGGGRCAGAVACVTTVKNPILAARLVMDRSDCVLLIGPDADAFARAAARRSSRPSIFRLKCGGGCCTRSCPNLTSRKNWMPPTRCGTVGCVALDDRGNLAAGTSTGGITGKMPGRVGDSPIIGGGTIADNASCAVSATGDGEYFIRAVAAHDIAAWLSTAASPWLKQPES